MEADICGWWWRNRCLTVVGEYYSCRTSSDTMLECVYVYREIERKREFVLGFRRRSEFTKRKKERLNRQKEKNKKTILPLVIYNTYTANIYANTPPQIQGGLEEINLSLETRAANRPGRRDLVKMSAVWSAEDTGRS